MAKSPAVRSPYDVPGRTGPPPGSPVIDMIPPIAWTTMSSAGRSLYGPVWPKPDTLAMMTRGLRAESTS